MPDWKAEIAARLDGLKVDPVREAEILDEMAQHLEDRYQELLRGGEKPEEAYQSIRAELGEGGKLMEELRKIEHVTRHEPIAWARKLGGTSPARSFSTCDPQSEPWRARRGSPPALRSPSPWESESMWPYSRPHQVVGIVSDLRSSYAATPLPFLYVPVDPKRPGRMFAARAQTGAALSAAELRDRIQTRIAMPRSVAIRYHPDVLSSGLLGQKFITMLFSTFGAVALILAAIGLYAVGSFEVALRRSEIGLRMSLGATPGNVQRLVIRETLGPVAVGLVIGIAGAYWASKFAQSWWYKINSRDPATYLVAAAVLIAATALAAWLPARRASRIDPMAALRCE